MVLSKSVQAVGLSCLGGAGGFIFARYIYPDVTYQEKTVTKPPVYEIPEPSSSQNKFSNLEKKITSSGILKYGSPSCGVPSILEYENHVLEYDPVKKVPKWVAEHISKEKVSGNQANRKQARFDKDPNIPAIFSSDNRDFRGSGWSRGHMAPAGNNKHSQPAMNQTFYLTNIVPQDLENNGNYWNRLEIYCRELTNQFSDVYIISGPLWLPTLEDENEEDTNLPIKWKNPPMNLPNIISTESLNNNASNDAINISEKGDRATPKPKYKKPAKKYVKYQVLGNNNVAVPTHLFKIILVEDPKLGRPMLGAFVVPNKPIQNVNLEQFEVELEEIEKNVGVKFHQELDRSEVSSLCVSTGCRLNNYKEFQDFFWFRRMSNPWSLRDLEKDWKTVCDMGLRSEKLNELYLNKKDELLEKQKAKELTKNITENKQAEKEAVIESSKNESDSIKTAVQPVQVAVAA